jgi:hypothetical protein
VITNNKIRSSIVLAALLTSMLIPAQAATAAVSAPESSCGTLLPKTAAQSDRDYRLAERSLADLCRAQGGASTQGTITGNYITLKASAPLKTCSCGSYRAYSVSANAVGVPYDGNGAHLSTLVLLWRVGSTGGYQSATAPVDTYNSIPAKTGTMGVNSRIEAVP